jgi:hypothetical protein
LFENILRELGKLDRSQGGISVPIQMPLDDDGYFDRRCPSAACQSDFKVMLEDWKSKVSAIRAFCPICREEAKATEWNTPEQCEYIRQIAIQHVRGIVGEALAQDTRQFNSQQRPGFIQMSLSYRPGAPTLAVPISAAEELRQKFTCEQCGCRYSSLGAAFFCPSCGHNSAETTSSQTMETVQKSLAALPAIREAVEKISGPDAAENAVRQILENNMVRIVGAFQRAAEGLFDRAPGAGSIPRRKNVFQSLAEGSALWREATGMGYDNLLTAAEMAELLRFFQQRHLLAHCEGMVDQDYINRSGDRTYSVGQRLVIREEAVERATDLASRLTTELKKLV